MGALGARRSLRLRDGLRLHFTFDRPNESCKVWHVEDTGGAAPTLVADIVKFTRPTQPISKGKSTSSTTMPICGATAVPKYGARLRGSHALLGEHCASAPDAQSPRGACDSWNSAFRLAVMVEMRVKHALACRRPAEYSPQIQPMLQTPAHGALPSGHCTEAYVVAMVLWSLCESSSASHTGGVFAQTGSSDPIWREELLLRQASRIAINRTIAGVHFPVDSAAGQVLGLSLAQYFTNLCTTGTTYDYWEFDGTAYPADFDWTAAISKRDDQEHERHGLCDKGGGIHKTRRCRHRLSGFGRKLSPSGSDAGSLSRWNIRTTPRRQPPVISDPLLAWAVATEFRYFGSYPRRIPLLVESLRTGPRVIAKKFKQTESRAALIEVPQMFLTPPAAFRSSRISGHPAERGSRFANGCLHCLVAARVRRAPLRVRNAAGGGRVRRRICRIRQPGLRDTLRPASVRRLSCGPMTPRPLRARSKCRRKLRRKRPLKRLRNRWLLRRSTMSSWPSSTTASPSRTSASAKRATRQRG